MPRKDESSTEQKGEPVQEKEKTEMLERMLAAVLNYLSDDEIEEIDLEYLLTNTKDLRKWWDQYREKNKKQVEDEIKKSLSKLSLEELENIREQIEAKNG
jgi:transposase-like protein